MSIKNLLLRSLSLLLIPILMMDPSLVWAVNNSFNPSSQCSVYLETRMINQTTFQEEALEEYLDFVKRPDQLTAKPISAITLRHTVETLLERVYDETNIPKNIILVGVCSAAALFAVQMVGIKIGIPADHHHTTFMMGSLFWRWPFGKKKKLSENNEASASSTGDLANKSTEQLHTELIEFLASTPEAISEERLQYILTVWIPNLRSMVDHGDLSMAEMVGIAQQMLNRPFTTLPYHQNVNGQIETALATAMNFLVWDEQLQPVWDFLINEMHSRSRPALNILITMQKTPIHWLIQKLKLFQPDDYNHHNIRLLNILMDISYWDEDIATIWNALFERKNYKHLHHNLKQLMEKSDVPWSFKAEMLLKVQYLLTRIRRPLIVKDTYLEGLQYHLSVIIRQLPPLGQAWMIAQDLHPRHSNYDGAQIKERQLVQEKLLVKKLQQLDLRNVSLEELRPLLLFLTEFPYMSLTVRADVFEWMFNLLEAQGHLDDFAEWGVPVAQEWIESQISRCQFTAGELPEIERIMTLLGNQPARWSQTWRTYWIQRIQTKIANIQSIRHPQVQLVSGLDYSSVASIQKLQFNERFYEPYTGGEVVHIYNITKIPSTARERQVSFEFIPFDEHLTNIQNNVQKAWTADLLRASRPEIEDSAAILLRAATAGPGVATANQLLRASDGGVTTQLIEDSLTQAKGRDDFANTVEWLLERIEAQDNRAGLETELIHAIIRQFHQLASDNLRTLYRDHLHHRLVEMHAEFCEQFASALQEISAETITENPNTSSNNETVRNYNVPLPQEEEQIQYNNLNPPEDPTGGIGFKGNNLRDLGIGFGVEELLRQALGSPWTWGTGLLITGLIYLTYALSSRLYAKKAQWKSTIAWTTASLIIVLVSSWAFAQPRNNDQTHYSKHLLPAAS